MKQSLRIVTVLLCAMVIIPSCTKENDPSNGGNGDNGGSGSGQINYTFGYYHPEKKIKEIRINGYRLAFVWDGDNLSYIENRGVAFYHFEYNAEGRVSCIWDSTGVDNYHKVTYHYYADRVEKCIIRNDGVGFWSDDTTNISPTLNIDYSMGYDQANNPLKDLMWYDFIECGYHVGPIASNHDARFLHNQIKSGIIAVP